MAEIMKGITCCADCAYYNMKKHKCTRATDEGKPTDHFYADCPLPTVIKAQGWISVKDRLPEGRTNPHTLDFEPVLCATVFEDIRVYKYGQRLGQTEAHFYHGYSWMDDYVTHWMPLPEPPKEDEA